MGHIQTRMRIYERWEDHRMSLSDGGGLEVRVKLPEEVWKPAGEFKHMIDTDAKWSVTYLFGNGLVTRLTEETVIIGCNFDYTWLPWDWQECDFTYYDT